MRIDFCLYTWPGTTNAPSGGRARIATVLIAPAFVGQLAPRKRTAMFSILIVATPLLAAGLDPGLWRIIAGVSVFAYSAFALAMCAGGATEYCW